VAADAGTVVQMNSASATTITVNTALFAAGDTVQIQNVGAGVCTVTAGTATVSTSATLALKQYDAGSLYFNTTSAAIFFAVDAADGMANVLTTTGDTIYSSSGTTAARLGIGSTGQVLTVASGVPSWATPSAGAATAVGCLVYNTGNQATSNATYKNLEFNAEVYDTDGFHSIVTNTQRITIPSGKAGKYLFTFLATFDGNATGRREFYIYKNGVSTSIMDGSISAVGAQDTGVTYVGSDDAIVGDYYSISVYQTSGGALNVRLGREKNFFSCIYLGA
jgi:hypothetical protein